MVRDLDSTSSPPPPLRRPINDQTPGTPPLRRRGTRQHALRPRLELDLNHLMEYLTQDPERLREIARRLEGKDDIIHLEGYHNPRDPRIRRRTEEMDAQPTQSPRYSDEAAQDLETNPTQRSTPVTNNNRQDITETSSMHSNSCGKKAGDSSVITLDLSGNAIDSEGVRQGSSVSATRFMEASATYLERLREGVYEDVSSDGQAETRNDHQESTRIVYTDDEIRKYWEDGDTEEEPIEGKEHDAHDAEIDTTTSEMSHSMLSAVGRYLNQNPEFTDSSMDIPGGHKAPEGTEEYAMLLNFGPETRWGQVKRVGTAFFSVTSRSIIKDGDYELESVATPGKPTKIQPKLVPVAEMEKAKQEATEEEQDSQEMVIRKDQDERDKLGADNNEGDTVRTIKVLNWTPPDEVYA